MKKISNLTHYRHQLNQLDTQLVNLLNQRAIICEKVARYKYQNGLKITDSSREKSLQDCLCNINPKSLPDHNLLAIHQAILKQMKQTMKTSPLYYLGPPGTYSHQAALNYSSKHPLIPLPTLKSVIDSVKKHPNTLGIIPIKNSIIGPIKETTAYLNSLDTKDSDKERLQLKTIDQITIPINMDLATSEKTKYSDITLVYTKQQALDQCKNWLDKNLPQAKRIAVNSTTDGISKLIKPGSAVICSPYACTLNQLTTVAPNIQNHQQNSTTFAIIRNIENA